jgi:alpha-ketoglutarate-dependent 2,4-dichlorophenoxyacetate dioxygenase
MSLQITPLFPGFAAEIAGVDAARVSDAEVAAIRAAMTEYAVVVLPDQHMDEAEQVAFGARFGPLDINNLAGKQGYNAGLRDDLLNVSNVGDSEGPVGPEDRRRLLDLGNKFWHTDSSFKAVTAHLSMLYGMRVAEYGGETQFADMRAGYAALPDDWKTLVEGLVAAHSGFHSRVMLGFHDFSAEHHEMQPTVAHDLVRVLPESGRKSLYLSAHASHIVGMPIPIGRMLLHELTELATGCGNVYSHKWRLNDFVIWDNRCTMHRLRRYRAGAEARVLRRVTTLDPTFPERDPATVVVDDWKINEAA